MKAVHADSRGTYRSPRVHEELKKLRRETSRKRVARVMREQGLAARSKKRFRRTTDSNHAFPVADNVLRPPLHGRGPERGVGHRHHLHLDARGVLYEAAIVDLHSRIVVGGP